MKTRTVAGFGLSGLLFLGLFFMNVNSRATEHRPEYNTIHSPVLRSAQPLDPAAFELAYQAVMDTIFGCTYPWATGYNPDATMDDGSCLEFCCPGDLNGDNYINVSDLIDLLGVFDTYCDDSIIYGCTDPGACNYYADATSDDGSCIFPEGCYDETACNFNPIPCDNNLLELPTEDCIYPDADGLCCGCSVDGTQLDFTPPTFTLVPQDQNNECDEQPYSYEYSDTCMENDAIEITETRDTLFSDECGNYGHLVTVTATDSCGNASSVQFSINVQDSDEPYLFLGQFPNDTILSCTEEWPEAGMTEGFDNCDGSVPVFYNEMFVDGECAGSYEILRTWLMQDCSGNEQTHQQTITIIDDELPFFTAVPEDQSNQCEEQPYTYEAFDNCNEVTVIESRDTLFADSCGNYEHLVTLTATDSCGNFADTTFMISVFDTEAPYWTNTDFPAEELSVSCEAIPSPWMFEAEDACDGAMFVNFTEESLDPNCLSQTVLTRTWTASDCTGNSISFTQTIAVIDTVAPVFVEQPPLDAFVECDAIPAADTLTALDNCDGPVDVLFEETLEPGTCPQSYTLVRSWTATDCAGNTTEHVQTIAVEDTQAPVFTLFPSDQINQCEEQAYAAEAEDNCGIVILTESREIVSEDACGNYEHLVTITAEDECGNSTSAQFTIVVLDTESPAFVEELPLDAVVECDAVPAASVLTAVDNCDEAVEVVYEEQVAIGECPQAYTLTRTWTTTDCSGNSAVHEQIIEVQDTTAPVFVDLPQDQVNQCDELPYNAQASDNCSSVTVNETREIISEDECGNYEHIVTLTATDACGNTAEHSFTIVVSDTEAPVFAEALPEDVQLNCSDGIPAAAELTALDNCDDLVVAFSEDTVSSECVTTFTRNWIASDCSGNTIEHSQLVVVTDDVAPIFTDLPAAVISLEADHECGADTSSMALGTPMVSDECSGWDLTYADSDFQEPCVGSFSFTRTWTATDECGNASEFEQSIEVLDLQAPSLEAAASDLIAECSGDGDQTLLNDWLNANGGAQAIDNCSSVTWAHDFNVLDATCAGGTVTVTFTATDDCGNSVSTAAMIEFVDTTAPVLLLAAEDATIECDGAGNPGDLDAWLASNGGATAEDACSDVTWSNDFSTLSDDCGSTGSATVTFTATDGCGNSTTTAATFTIVDTSAPIIMEAQDLTVECDGQGNVDELNEWLEANGLATAEDACSAVTWTNDFTAVGQGCGTTGATAVTFTANDACGNASTTTAIFTITDTTGPEITLAPEALVVECDGDGNQEAIADWLQILGGAEASDICSAAEWTHDFTGIVGDCGATGSTVVTFTATDECGNSTSVQSSIVIEDTTAPVITMEAADLTVECDGNGNNEVLNQWLSSHGGASATDTCSTITWSNNFEALEPVCGNTGFATVEFTASDACGNSTVTTATFTIIDTEAPQFTSLPIDQNSQCEELPFEAVAVDVCSEVEVIETREVISEDGCGNYEHLVTLTAADGCGNEALHQFTIIVQDTIAPDLNEAIPADVTIGCGELEDAPVITATDNCDAGVEVVYTEEIVGEETGCSVEYQVIRTWTATDCSGNVQSATQTISVVDESLPEWDVEIPAVAYVECDAIPDPALVTASDNCDADVQITFEEVFEPGPCPNRYVLHRTWTATDECGNSIQATQDLTVLDSTAPEWVGELPPAQVTVTSCDDIPEPPVLEAVDNCDGETLVIFNEFFSPASGCSEVCECGGVVVRTWISSDACGNLATFVQYYSVLNIE